MAQSAVTVPCAGDKLYTRALKTIASRRGVRMADIVRKALDTSEYATEIEKEMTPFFTSDAVLTQHNQASTAKESV